MHHTEESEEEARAEMHELVDRMDGYQLRLIRSFIGELFDLKEAG